MLIAKVFRRASGSELDWEDAGGPDATERGIRIGESSDDRELGEEGLGGLTRGTKEVLAEEGRRKHDRSVVGAVHNGAFIWHSLRRSDPLGVMIEGRFFRAKATLSISAYGLWVNSRENTGGCVALVDVYTKIIKFFYTNFS